MIGRALETGQMAVSVGATTWFLVCSGGNEVVHLWFSCGVQLQFNQKAFQSVKGIRRTQLSSSTSPSEAHTALRVMLEGARLRILFLRDLKPPCAGIK